MDRSVGWCLTAAVWIANIAVTALAVRGLEHPKPYVPAADVWQPTPERVAKQVVYAKSGVDEPAAAHAAIEMPMVTIVASASQQGRASMQGGPDVVMGPGTVTHPSAIPPRPGH